MHRSPGPPGIIPWGGGPIICIIGGPPIGGVGSMPGRGGPPGLFPHTSQDMISVKHYDCVLFSITSLNRYRPNELSEGGLTWRRPTRERRGSDLPLLERRRCWGRKRYNQPQIVYNLHLHLKGLSQFWDNTLLDHRMGFLSFVFDYSCPGEERKGQPCDQANGEASVYLFYRWGSAPAPPSTSDSSLSHFLCVFCRCSASSSPTAAAETKRHNGIFYWNGRRRQYFEHPFRELTESWVR